MRSPVARIEIAGRLVREQHVGPRDERACDRDALLLTARQLSRVVSRRAAARPTRSSTSRGRSRASRRAGELERQHHVLERRQRRHQVKRLEHEADVLARARAARPSSSSDVSSWPASQTCPARGLVESPASSASSVDLPAPEARSRRRFRRARSRATRSSRMVERSLRAANLLAQIAGGQHLVDYASSALVVYLCCFAEAARGGRRDAGPDDPRRGRQPERWLRDQAGAGLGGLAASSLGESTVTRSRQYPLEQQDDQQLTRIPWHVTLTY